LYWYVNFIRRNFLVTIVSRKGLSVWGATDKCGPGPPAFQLPLSCMLTFGRTPWTRDMPITRPFCAQQHTNTGIYPCPRRDSDQ
jgi:hypothetical protein